MAQQRMPRLLVALLALTSGLTAANLWYITPLLNGVADDFHASKAAAGLLVTAVQGGYVVGLALLVPLGDLFERRALITRVLVGTAAAATLCALAPSIAWLTGALVLLGLTACVAQIVVPLASVLAGPQERGQVVGTVMSGLLIGVLLARTVAGLVAEVAGWRSVFVLAAASMLVLGLVLRRALPRVEPTERLTYPALLRSVGTLIAAEPVLRQRMALGACCMACFSMLWTAIAFLLGDAPFDYGEGVIGLFGLLGVVGASVAPVAGRLTDRGHARLVTTGFMALLLAGWGLLALGRTTLPPLMVGIVVLDAGVQGTHITNQAAIYALAPELRSRLTTAYMVAYFLGGTAGTLLGTLAYDAGGWEAVCAVGAGIMVVAFALWGLTRRVGVTATT
jgi:predicted MFS family arabinose efflux permease